MHLGCTLSDKSPGVPRKYTEGVISGAEESVLRSTLFVHLSQKYPYAGVHFTRLPSRSTYYLKGFANVPVVSLAVDDMDDD